MDLNGDGLSDVVYVYHKEGDAQTVRNEIRPYMNTGNGSWVKEAVSVMNSYADNKTLEFHPMDANGDGMTDLVMTDVWRSGTDIDKLKMRVYQSSGSKFALATRWDGEMEQGHDNEGFFSMDVNGDGLLDMVQVWNGVSNAGSHNLITYLASVNTHYIKTITNGLGGITTIAHKPLADTNVYKKESNATYPIQDVQNGMQVVSSYTEKPSATHAGYTNDYFYVGNRLDINRGSLGFRQIWKTSKESDVRQITTYHQDYPKIGMPSTHETLSPRTGETRNIMAKEVFTYLNLYDDITTYSPAIYHLVPTSETRSFFKPGILYSPSTTPTPSYSLQKKYNYSGQSSECLAYGNVSMIEDLGSTISGKTSPRSDDVWRCNIYEPADETKNIIGYPAQTKVTKTRQGCENFLSTSNPSAIEWNSTTDLSWEKNTYDEAYNIKTQSTYFDTHSSEASSAWVTNRYTYDGIYGNVAEIKKEANNESDIDITYKITYDTDYFTFPKTLQTPLNAQGVSLTYILDSEPYFGNVLSITDPNLRDLTNLLPNRTEYDKLGRAIELHAKNPSNGSLTKTTSLATAKNSIGAYTERKSLVAWDNSTNLSVSRNYFDGLKRSFQSERDGEDPSNPIVTTTTFDNQGRPYSESTPYYKNDGPGKAIALAEYNYYDHPHQLTSPSGVVQCFTYIFPEDSSSKLSNSSAIENYSMGISTIIRPSSTSTTNCKDILEGISMPDDRTTTKYFNSRGNVIKSIPNHVESEAVYYNYNALQQLTSMQDPGGLITSYTYDSLGNVKSIQTPDKGLTNFVYDGFGRLVQRHNKINTNTGQILSSIDYTYDNLDRPLSKTLKNADGSYNETTRFFYDEVVTSPPNYGLGKLTTVCMPDVGNTDCSPDNNVNVIKYQYAYDYNGTPARLTITQDENEYKFSSAIDPLGRIIEYTLPDLTKTKYTYNKNGNLLTVAHNNKNYAIYDDFTAIGQPGKITLGNNIVTSYTYAPAATSSPLTPVGTITTMSAGKSDMSAMKVMDFGYTWKDFNIQTVTDKLNEAKDIANQCSASTDLRKCTATTAYSYDLKQDYLTGTTNPYNSQANQVFTYDKAGDILTKEHQSSTAEYIYKPNTHQITEAKIKDASTSFLTREFDNEGRLSKKTDSSGTQAETLVFLYDAEDKLRAVKTNTGTIINSYVYDFLGNRITKIDKEDSLTKYLTSGYEIFIPSDGTAPLYTTHIIGYNRIASITINGSKQ